MKMAKIWIALKLSTKYNSKHDKNINFYVTNDEVQL